MIDELYLAIFLILLLIAVIRYFSIKYNFQTNRFHYISPEVFAQQWIQDIQDAPNDSIKSLKHRLTDNLDDQKTIIIQNMNNIKTSLSKDITSLDIKQKKQLTELVIEQLRKVTIIIAVVQLKFQYEKDEQVNILKSISNVMFQKQDVLVLIKNYVNKNKDQTELQPLLDTASQYREYILNQLSHYMYPY